MIFGFGTKFLIRIYRFHRGFKIFFLQPLKLRFQRVVPVTEEGVRKNQFLAEKTNGLRIDRRTDRPANRDVSTHLQTYLVKHGVTYARV